MLDILRDRFRMINIRPFVVQLHLQYKEILRYLKTSAKSILVSLGFSCMVRYAVSIHTC